MFSSTVALFTVYRQLIQKWLKLFLVPYAHMMLERVYISLLWKMDWTKWFKVHKKVFIFQKYYNTVFSWYFENGLVQVLVFTRNTRIVPLKEIFSHPTSHILWNSTYDVLNRLLKSFSCLRLNFVYLRFDVSPQKSNIGSNGGSQGCMKHLPSKKSGDQERDLAKFCINDGQSGRGSI